MNKIWGLILALALIFIISCTNTNPPTENIVLSPETQTQPLENFSVTETTIPNLCKDVKCGEGQQCKEGKCVCAINFKDCNGKCISAKNCCAKSECGSREDCINNTCTQVEACNYLEKWDAEKDRCVCQESTRYCATQTKCIPVDHCCILDDCNLYGGNERYCTPTDFKPYLCLKKAGNKACGASSLIKGRNSYTILNEGYDIYLDNVFENKNIDLRIAQNKTEITIKNMKLGEEFITSLGIITYETLEDTGGGCRSA